MLCFPSVLVGTYVTRSITRCRDAEVYGTQATSTGESAAFMSTEEATGLFLRTPEATSRAQMTSRRLVSYRREGKSQAKLILPVRVKSQCLRGFLSRPPLCVPQICLKT